MRTLQYTLAVGLLAGLGACSNMMGGGNQAPKTVVSQPTLAPDMVKQVQSKLRDDGYYKQGAVDGVWGAGTETAVRLFQRDHNLGSSGQLDVPTLQALNVTGGPSMTNTMSPTTNTVSPTQPMNSDPNATYSPAAPPPR